MEKAVRGGNEKRVVTGGEKEENIIKCHREKVQMEN